MAKPIPLPLPLPPTCLPLPPICLPLPPTCLHREEAEDDSDVMEEAGFSFMWGAEENPFRCVRTTMLQLL